jgi:hypothetical protein
MQRELPTFVFTGEAEVRSQAEHRRTEEVAGGPILTFASRLGRHFCEC